MAGPYYVDVTTGADGDSGLSEANAWQTLEKLADGTIQGGEKCYVKGSASYVVQDGGNDCVMYIDNNGGAIANSPVIIEGYTTTPGDRGIFTIDADVNTLASAIKTAINGNVFWIFRNIRGTGASGDGFDANGIIDDAIIFENCQLDNNDGWGFQGDNNIVFYNCTGNNNGTGTFDPDIAYYIGNKAYTGGGIALNSSEVALFNLCYDNGGNVNIRANSGSPTIFANNTIDGENAANSIGLFNDSSTCFINIMLNNILHDLDVGVKSDTPNTISDYNLFNSNTTDRTNIDAGDNDVAAVPDFENEGARDYRIKATSSAYKAGFDAGEI